jgi:protein FAM50
MSDNLSKEKGDFHEFHRPAAGSRTVEGNTSGARAMFLEKQRKADQAEFEAQKRRRLDDTKHASLSIRGKFQSARIGSVEEQAFRAKTVGLVTAEEFLAATNEKEGRGNPRELTKEEREARNQKEEAAAKKLKKKLKKKKKERKQRAALLSFGGDGDEDEIDKDDEEETKKETNPFETTKSSGSSKKDPSIDTSFLPDRAREDAQKAERIRLEQEWKDQQEATKREKLQITYSYWDGSGHRRTCTIRKGDSIGDGFLEVVRKDLCRDFRELKNVASDALLYVKEDLILPHDITFYDLIATKARGKSGPLFRFDVKDDIRTGSLDIRVERDESHPGKVVERSWYEKNKHIFPASRWEVYDPSKNYGGYTIAGKIVTTKDNQNDVFQK